MKRKRGRKPGHKNTPRNAVADGLPKSPASPSMEENSSADESHNALVNSEEVVVVPEPAVSRPEDRITASDKPADVPFVKPKVGAVYGRVRVKLKSSRLLEPHQSSSDVQTGSDVQKAGDKVTEGITEVAVEKDTILSDGQSSEVRGSDSDKTARKVGSIKIKSRGLSSVSDTTQDRNANKVEDPPPPIENVSENKESKGLLEPKILSEQEVEVKQSSPEHHRDEKELAAALEVIKKVMKMDAAEPFNTPVDPVALGIPDYFDVIDTPMDFGTICQDLEHGNKYMNSEDVYKDVQFIWDNCTKYNSKGDYIMDLMKRVKKAFMKNWLAAGLYSDVPDNGANNNSHNADVMLSSQEKGHPKSKSKHKRRRQGIDRHKNDCLCAVCVVTRRRKERDENWAANEDEIAVISSNLSQQNNMEENSPVDIPSSHDATSSREPSPQTNVYRERGDGEKDKRVAIPMQLETSQPMEVDTRGNQVDDFGKCINSRPYDLLPLDSQGEGSSENLEDEEGAECKDPDKMEHHASAQPNDDSRVAHHQQEAPIETSQEVEMQDYLVPQENHLALQLCASLFPSNQRSIFRGPHSLFHRQPSSRESPIHAAVATILKP